MNPYRGMGTWNTLKAIRRGRFLQRLWNVLLWRTGTRILRRFTR